MPTTPCRSRSLKQGVQTPANCLEGDTQPLLVSSGFTRVVVLRTWRDKAR